MKIALIGASGFIGGHLSSFLKNAGHEVICTCTDTNATKIGDTRIWKELKFEGLNNYGNLHEYLGQPDFVVLLAWSGLPNFDSDHHLTFNLPYSILLCHKLKNDGSRNLAVLGTCLEYGMLEGCISPDAPTKPVTKYGMAKDILRKHLFEIDGFDTIKWFRIFYIFGDGQFKSSLYPQILTAVKCGSKEFNMSKGDQVRDFIPIEEAVSQISSLLLTEGSGVYNIGSGKPETVLDFVKRTFEKNNYSPQLNLGFYPYPYYEPFKFWADISNH